MIRSMTGFARRDTSGDWGALTIEIRAVNHRFLELSLRLPEDFRTLDPKFRELIGARLNRGKIDISLRFTAGQASVAQFDVNRGMVKALAEASYKVAQEWPELRRVSAFDVLRWPGVVVEQERDHGPEHSAAMQLLDEALTDLFAAREREGARLREGLEERCAAIVKEVARVRDRLPEVRVAIRKRLLERLEDLDIEHDESRFEQELAMIAQRMDVSEELDRIDSHVAEAAEVLESDEPVGRRLDFLMQEFNREANTLGSKSQDGVSTKVAMELKVLIEQMREQVQNIE